MAIAWVCLFAHAAMGQKEDELCNFSANASITCSGVEVRFNTTSGNAPYTWNFGDGTPNMTGNPPIFHSYVDVNPDLMPVTAMLSFPGDSCEKVVPFPGIFLGEGCGSQRTLSNLVTNNKLPANELVGKTVYLYGDLVVDIPYIFNGCTVIVSGGGKIRIASGGSLTLNNNTMMDALSIMGPVTCQSLWNGIEVQSGGKLITNGATIQNAYFAIATSNTGNLNPIPMVSLTNTTFKRNFIGLYVANGSFIVSKFVNNVFEGSSYNPIYPASTCNIPAPIGGIPYSQRTYCGIYFEGTLGGKLLLAGQSVNNVFKDLQAGIVCLNGTAFIQQCRFENILFLQNTPASYRGTAVSFIDNVGGKQFTFTGFGKGAIPTINNCERGVFVCTTKQSTTASISQCRMEEISNGVEFEEGTSPGGLGNFSMGAVSHCYIGCTNYLDNIKKRTTGIEVKDPNIAYSNFVIGDNDIDVNQPEAFTPFNLVDPEILPTGINVVAMHNQASGNAMDLSIGSNNVNLIEGVNGITAENVANANIYENTVTTATDSGDEMASIGVTGGINNSVFCNTVTATAQGQNSVYVGIGCAASPNIRIDGNTLTDMTVGIAFHNDNETNCFVSYNDLHVVNNTFSVGVTYNTAQSGPQYLQGNDWLGDFAGGAFYFQGAGAFTYCTSLYHVSDDANVANGINPVVVTNSQNCDGISGDDLWFTVLEDSEDDFICTSIPGGGTPAKNTADLNLAGGGLAALSLGYKWSSEMGLIRKFTENPSLASGDPIITNFLQAQTGQPVSTMFDLRNEINGLESSLNPALISDINSTLLQLDAINIAQIDLLDIIDVDLYAQASYALINLQTAELEQLLQSYFAMAMGIKAQGATILNGINTATNCPFLPCAAEQTINSLYLETQLLTPHYLTPSELASVQQIGLNCPGETGSIVYLARAWYYLQTGTTLNSPCDNFTPPLVSIERTNRSPIKKSNDLEIMPNPANNILTVVLPSGSEGETLEIRNIWGQILVVRKIPPSDITSTLTISVDGFAPGIYFVSRIGDSRKSGAKKLTIHH